MTEIPEDYSVGIKSLDEQHAELLKLTGELHDAIDRDATVDLTYTVIRLSVYALYHFATEEQLMEKYGYNELAEHREEHEKFTARVEEFKRRVEDGETGLAPDLLQFLGEWIKDHLAETDIKYADFFIERGVS